MASSLRSKVALCLKKILHYSIFIFTGDQQLKAGVYMFKMRVGKKHNYTRIPIPIVFIYIYLSRV